MMRCLLTLLLALAPLPLLAATGSAAVRSHAPVTSDSLLNVVLALALVIGAIFVLAWLVRRVQGGAGFTSKGMKVVAMLPLSPRERVALVDVGGRQLLLGVAPGRVTLLQSFDEPVVSGGNPGGEFRERLRQALQPGGGRE